MGTSGICQSPICDNLAFPYKDLFSVILPEKSSWVEGHGLGSGRSNVPTRPPQWAIVIKTGLKDQQEFYGAEILNPTRIPIGTRQCPTRNGNANRKND